MRKAELFFTGRYSRQFEELETLGKGGFGVVFKARDKFEEKVYAVKKIRLHLPLKEDLVKALKGHKVYREVLA